MELKFNPFTSMVFSQQLVKALIITLALSACSSLPKPLPTDDAAITDRDIPRAHIEHLDADQKSQLFYTILLANMAQKKGLLEIAQSNYEDALEKTNSPRLASHTAKLALLRKDYSATAQAIKRWKSADPKSMGPLKTELLVALQREQPEQVYQLLRQWLETDGNPNNPQPQFQELLQLALYQSSENNKLEQQQLTLTKLLSRYNQAALTSATNNSKPPQGNPASLTAEAFLRLKSRSPLANLAKIHQLLDLSLRHKNNFLGAVKTKTDAYALLSPEKAADYLQNLLKQNIFSKQQLFNLANSAYKTSDFTIAINGFKRILEVEPDNLEARYLLAASYYGNENFKQSADLFWQLSLDDYRKETSSFYCGDGAQRVAEENDDYLAKSISCYQMVPAGNNFLRAQYRLAQIFAEQEMFDQGVRSLQNAQSLVDFNQRQQLLKFEINYLIKHKQFDTAKQRLDNAIELEPDNNTIYYLQLLFTDKTQPPNQLLVTSKSLRDKAPNFELRKDVIFMTVDFLSQNKLYRQAFELLTQESARYPQDIDLLYTKALANEPLNNIKQLEKDLRAVLRLDPEHTGAQNSLGYTLADQNYLLAEARRLLEAAYQARPDDAAILDSMGWLYYRLGELKRSLKFIEQAYKQQPLAEVAAHLGEVLWQLGERDKAKQVWQKALQQAPDNQYILDTLARFPEAGLAP